VAAAILEGEDETGVTIMLMDEEMDHGPILAQRTTPIRDVPERQADTRGTLMTRLAELGADLLLETLPRWLAGDIEPQPQPHDRATYAHMLRKEAGEIDWSQPADRIARMTRAFDPWPGAFTYWDGQLFKILRASPVTAGNVPNLADIAPGTVIETNEGVAVSAGAPSTSPSTEPVAGEALSPTKGVSKGGAVLLEEVQLAGKRAMDIESFLRGQREFVGSLLGRALSSDPV
jgi:methionyl-tRNA formyltransferase